MRRITKSTPSAIDFAATRKVWKGRELMSEESCVAHPWCPSLCRSYGFVMMVYSSQLIMYRAWRFDGCAWSMRLQWRKSPERVGLLPLRRTSHLGVASGYTSNILELKQETRAGMIRLLNGCWPLSAYPLAHYIYYTTIHSFSRYDTLIQQRTQGPTVLLLHN